MTIRILGCLIIAIGLSAPALAESKTPLPSWNDGAAKTSIIEFVDSVTEEGGDKFVAEEDRIAVFDNDGTLWAEQPVYAELLYAFARVKELAPQHPEWKTQEPFASIVAGDFKKALSGGREAIGKVLAVTHAGMTSAEFNKLVAEWFKTAENPAKKEPVAEMNYVPMMELMSYLRANGFKTFIVSGGSIDFMRAFTDDLYGVPPYQVVGTSSAKLAFEVDDKGLPVLNREPGIVFVDDGPGKPVGIQTHIGQKPIMAFGNSDGDLQMLQFTCLEEVVSYCAYIHHTDAKREWAYDRDSSIGKLDKGLDAANANGWTLVDMAKDWKTIFDFQQ